MANTITRQTLIDGPRNLVVKVHILGDASGDETNTSLIDVSTYAGAPDRVRIDRITWSGDVFDVHMHWDATANVDILTLASGQPIDQKYDGFGGLINNAGTGVTGDILFSTVGLGAEEGTIILEMVKKSA